MNFKTKMLGSAIILLLLMVGCKDSNKVCKDTDVNIDVINNVGYKSVFAKMAYM